jgi:hypothetical protein
MTLVVHGVKARKAGDARIGPLVSPHGESFSGCFGINADFEVQSPSCTPMHPVLSIHDPVGLNGRMYSTPCVHFFDAWIFHMRRQESRGRDAGSTKMHTF